MRLKVFDLSRPEDAGTLLLELTNFKRIMATRKLQETNFKTFTDGVMQYASTSNTFAANSRDWRDGKGDDDSKTQKSTKTSGSNTAAQQPDPQGSSNRNEPRDALPAHKNLSAAFSSSSADGLGRPASATLVDFSVKPSIRVSDGNQFSSFFLREVEGDLMKANLSNIEYIDAKVRSTIHYFPCRFSLNSLVGSDRILLQRLMQQDTARWF